MVKVVFAGCTPGRSPVGLRLPGEGNNQPRRGSVCCASAAEVKSCADSRCPFKLSFQKPSKTTPFVSADY